MYFKEGGHSFLNNEKQFDEKYFEIRKKHLSETFYYRIFTMVKTEPIKNIMLPKALYPREWTDPNTKLTIRRIDSFLYNMYMSFIDDIYDDIKDLESPISKKFFEPRPIKIDYWNGEEGYDIRTIVRNIVSNIPSKEYLSIKEVFQILYLVHEIAINGIVKNPVKLEALVEAVSKMRYKNPREDIYHQLILPSEFSLGSLFFEGLGRELNINISIFDIRPTKSIGMLPVIYISSEHPLKELSYLGTNIAFYGLYISH